MKSLPSAMAWIAVTFAGASAAYAQLPTVQLSAGIHLVRAEVASSDETRVRGLMFRESLGPNEGMLFVFRDAAVHCMWMRNTLIPLSVAFIDEAGGVVSISEMRPRTETSHCAAAPVKYALEMQRGWFAAKGVKSGARIRGLERAPPAH